MILICTADCLQPCNVVDYKYSLRGLPVDSDETPIYVNISQLFCQLSLLFVNLCSHFLYYFPTTVPEFVLSFHISIIYWCDPIRIWQ